MHKSRTHLGWFMLRGMNGGHTPISTWGLSLVHPAQDARALDMAAAVVRTSQG
jgi:hypothetical protein